MNAQRSNIAPDATRITMNRHAPLNSVSTRIILCVFVSTFMTALIVSWLSVGAIHNDVERRVTLHTRAVLADRSASIMGWHAEATAQLAASSAIGTPWHAMLQRAMSDSVERASLGLHWVAPRSEGVAAADRRHRRYGYLVGGLGVFVVWNLTTVLGFVVFSNAGDLITDLGLDVAGPAAFLALLWPRLADRRQLATAVAGAVIAVMLVPVAPAGVPILMSMFGVAAARFVAPPPLDNGTHAPGAPV